jgi:hypothetical protein
MKTKRLYAKAMKKLKEVPEISPELDLIHHYVCELRKPHVQVQTVEVHDDERIRDLEAQLHELTAKHKELEQKYAFEKNQPRYPSAPNLSQRQQVMEYIKSMAAQGIRLIKGTGSPADFGAIVNGLITVLINESLLHVDKSIGFKIRSLPKGKVAEIGRNVHSSLDNCLASHLHIVRALLESQAQAPRAER